MPWINEKQYIINVDSACWDIFVYKDLEFSLLKWFEANNVTSEIVPHKFGSNIFIYRINLVQKSIQDLSKTNFAIKIFPKDDSVKDVSSFNKQPTVFAMYK